MPNFYGHFTCDTPRIYCTLEISENRICKLVVTSEILFFFFFFSFTRNTMIIDETINPLMLIN